MTRRGSLAYYFAAVVCGCFFAAAASYAHSLRAFGAGERWARDFLFAYFIALIVGFLYMLLFGFVLRRVTRLLRWRAWWQWLLAGAACGAGLLWVFARIGLWIEATHFSFEMQRYKAGLMFAFTGPVMLSFLPVWLPPLAFAATAGVLYLIHRAFDSPRGAP